MVYNALSLLTHYCAFRCTMCHLVFNL